MQKLEVSNNNNGLRNVNSNITLGELMLDRQTAKAVDLYIENEMKRNSFLTFEVDLSKRYTEHCHISQDHRAILVDDFVKHFSTPRFFGTYGVGRIIMNKLLNELYMFGFNVIITTTNNNNGI